MSPQGEDEAKVDAEQTESIKADPAPVEGQLVEPDPQDRSTPRADPIEPTAPATHPKDRSVATRLAIVGIIGARVGAAISGVVTYLTTNANIKAQQEGLLHDQVTVSVTRPDWAVWS